MRLTSFCILVFFGLFLDSDAMTVDGQLLTGDTSAPVKQINNNSLIYTGPEYSKVYTSASGNPFFRDQAIRGWVNYFDNRYEDISLYYDIETDWLIYYEPVNQIRISLVNEKVDGFMIDGHRFITLKDATGFRGFYEILYQGRRLVLVKWFKILTRTGAEEGKYITYSNVYIQDSTTVQQVSNRKGLFNYFGSSNKKKLQQYYQDQHMNYKKEPAHTVSAIVSWAEKNGF